MALLDYLGTEKRPAGRGMLLNYRAPLGVAPNLVREPFPTLGRASSFPTQYAGFTVQKTSGTIELCLVATTDGAIGMGGVPMVSKGGVTYALYLVETSDSNASPVRIQTSAGVKSVRLKT